uniref:ATP-binding cassette domain-containing protein n=1 Tax=Cohnella sp. GbtcB17 TaxID=2824762 RepID=UPI001C2F7498
AGRTTLLRCINLPEQPDGGAAGSDGHALMAKGTNIADIRTEAGMVFQRFNLVPHKKVLEILTLAQIQVRKRTPGEAKERAMPLLRKVGLEDKADAYPDSL